MVSKRSAILIIVTIVIIAIIGGVLSYYLLIKPTEERQEYPIKPIKHIIPWSAGGGTDTVMRKFMTFMEKSLSELTEKPVSIYSENIVGASSGIGVYELMNSPPDGYTIGTLTWDSVITVPYFGLVEGYDLSKLRFVCTVTQHPTLLAVKADAPWKTLQELIEDAKRRPKEIKVANVGYGGVWHLPVLDLERKAGVEFTHVAFPGGATGEREALIKGEVLVASISYAGILPALKAGQARVLVVFGEERLPQLPDVPTAKELGYDVVWGSFRIIAVPAETPDWIINLLAKACKMAAENPEWKAWMNEFEGGGAIYLGPEETTEFVKKMQEKAFQFLDELVEAGIIQRPKK